ncbi:zinc finger protein [Macleaya cordata]|uniref:E3 SUMO-protein ligase SIZ1 n=1 Tax=Macleaya cordata TaxID=56857 RepID=A0A200QHA9_MACCD|nr:zinc finger protein [Macleaya cordata]
MVDKLAYFRIKELKDVLTQLGVAKQGKKQDLVDRILALLSDEQVSKMPGWPKKNSMGKEGIVKIIDDTYRKMQIPGATDLASKGQTDVDINNMKLKEEIDDSLQLDMKVRCLCGSSLPNESMIQCEDTRCRVWQHIGCVIIPEKPTEGAPPVPSQFYCEICRISRADPFWFTVAHPLHPVKLTVTSLPTDGTNPVQSVEKTFQLTRVDRDLLQKAEYDVQAWCMLLNDKVTFRMQWPQYSDLQVNGVPVRTVNRPGPQLLGANGRDDGPAITTCTREGINKIFLSGCDSRIFCLGVRIARRRTVQQVLNMIPKESEGESFDDALARVCRCIGGGNAAENADSDSDLEVVADSVTVNLRCPMSGSRMKTAGRFKPCVHMGCFDLETFVELNQRSRKWQCPICLKNYSLEHIIIDPYFNRITTLMQDCGEDVNEIDVKPDGSWRAKNEHERKDLAQWHSPGGDLCLSVDREVKPDLENSKIKQEVLSEGHNVLRLGIKKNRNGVWEVSKPEEMQTPSSENRLQVKFENPKVIPMSSSATGSCRDGEDPSVNQDGGGHYDFSTNNGNELDTISLNFDPTCTVASRVPSAPLGGADVIVLSDSDEDNENLTGTLYGSHQANTGGIPFSVPPGLPDSYPDDPDLGTSGGCLGLFNGNCEDFGMPLWPLPSGTQAGPGFQLFGTETNVSDSFVDVEHTSVPTSVNGYALAPDIAMGSVTQVPDSNNDINGGLVDNPLAFGADDPSLQIFLPSHPADASVQADLRDQPETPSGARTDDWISLRLGGGGGGGSSASSIGHLDSGTTKGLSSRHQVASKEGRMESLANTGLCPYFRSA